MREIKFRALDRATKKMEYFYSLDITEDNTGLICQGDAGSIDLETLGQYTGLDDINGKEIYEGDILVSEQSNYEFTYLITWDERRACFVGTYKRFYILPEKWDKTSIIGNIHENPELLKV